MLGASTIVRLSADQLQSLMAFKSLPVLSAVPDAVDGALQQVVSYLDPHSLI